MAKHLFNQTKRTFKAKHQIEIKHNVHEYAANILFIT